MAEKNKPVKKIRAGAISATIWKNEAEVKGKGLTTFYTVGFERSYKDKDGNWKSTNSLNMADIPKGQYVLRKAYEFLIEMKNDSQPKISEETIE